MTETSPLRVVVAGGGIAGVEALLALKDLAGDRVAVTLLDPSDEFVYRPFAVAQPFGLGHAERIPHAQLAKDAGARWVQDGLAEVDDAAGTVKTTGGETIEFDALLVTVGAVPVEGVEHATTWWPGGDPEILGGLLRDLEEGYSESVAFLIPSGFTWPLPAYELALMAAREVGGMGSEVELSVVTPEAEPLALFGEAASAALREELANAGVQLVAGTPPNVTKASGGADIAGADGNVALHAKRLLAIPRLVGPAIAGVPADDEGFTRIGDDAKVEGLTRTWAAGDGTASPLKLGGLATWQARRAAAAIAELAGADTSTAVADDELVLEGVLMTGAQPRQLDGAQQEKVEHRPVWRPSGKVAGRWLPKYVGDEKPEIAQEPDGTAVRIEITASDVRGIDAGSIFDLSRPLHPNSPDLQRLGRRMHGQHGP